jgi:hypothetical protein
VLWGSVSCHHVHVHVHMYMHMCMYMYAYMHAQVHTHPGCVRWCITDVFECINPPRRRQRYLGSRDGFKHGIYPKYACKIHAFMHVPMHAHMVHTCF